MNHGEIVSFLWGVADLIRDTFKRGKYQDVILPLTVLRRLDCVLARTKAKVLKGRKPTRPPARVRIVRFSGAMLSYGVVRRAMRGVPVSITSPARTVVDCFRYRNKVGIDVAMEALREAVRTRKATVDEISRTANVCRIRTVIGPYLEALST